MKKTSLFTKTLATTLAALTALSTFCFAAFASEEKVAAELYTEGRCKQYTSIEEAWSQMASCDTEVRLVLKEDWTADEDGFGEGKGFDRGALSLVDMYEETVIDLNGHTIDRNLSESIVDGHVLNIKNCTKLTITDSSEEKTGTLTGAKSKSFGGAVNVLGSYVKFENITIRDNKAGLRGGAFYISKCTIPGGERYSKVTIDNCTITGNEAEKGGAVYIEFANTLSVFDTVITGNKALADAGIHTEVVFLETAKITLGGKVIIADNIAEKDGTGLMLDESFFTKVYVKYDKSRPLEEGSRIVILSKTDDKTLRITDDSSEYYFDCYEYENDSYEIVKKGSGNDKYLDIKKA